MKKTRWNKRMLVPILICVCFLSCPVYAASDVSQSQKVKQENVKLEEVTDYFSSLSIDEIGKNIGDLKGVQGEVSKGKMMSEDTQESVKADIKKIPRRIMEMIKKDILWLGLLLILSFWLFIRKLKEGKNRDRQNQDIE